MIRQPIALTNWKMEMTILDGLGAGRKGRDPDAFAQILGLIAQTKLHSR
jgi:hypothetical protein